MKLTVADFCPGSGDATETRLTGSSVVETGVFEVDGSSAMPGSSNCRDSSAFEPDARTAFASPAGFANPLLTENASPESDPGPWMLSSILPEPSAELESSGRSDELIPIRHLLVHQGLPDPPEPAFAAFVAMIGDGFQVDELLR